MPDEEGHVTHFTVPELPWKRPPLIARWPAMSQEMLDDCCVVEGSLTFIEREMRKYVGGVIQQMAERVDQEAMGTLLEGVTPANVHPEYDPAYECEDCETPECEED